MSDVSGRIKDYIKNMPSLSVTVSKVLEICNNPQTSPADLNHVISLDPVLVGRVLKLINSAYYGFGQQVTSLVRAITILGINTVKNLAVSSAVLRSIVVAKKIDGLDIEGFWRHSLCVGVAAKLIAKKRNVDPKLIEEYFTAGLLHDIGKIPLNAVVPDEYLLAVSESDRNKIPLIRVEEKKLGINHCAAGGLIVKAWKLEGSAGDAILYHHNHNDYCGEYRDILYSVILANRFALLREIGFAGSRYSEKTDPLIWESLGLDEKVFDEMEPVVNGEIEKARIFLKLQNV